MGLTFAGQGGLVLLGAVSGIILARLLGPEGKGVFTAVTTAAGMIALLVEFGLRTAMTRAIAAGRATWKDALATTLALYGMLSLVWVPILILLLLTQRERLFADLPLALLTLGLIIVPLSLLRGALHSVLDGHHLLPETRALLLVERFSIILGYLLFIVFFGLGVRGAVLALLAGTAVGLLATLLLMRRLDNPGPPRIRRELIPELFRFGRAIYASFLAQSFNYRLDALILFAITGDAAVGLYSVAVALAEMPLNLPDSMASVLFPRVSSDTDGAEVRTAHLSRVTVFVILASGLVMALVGYPFIALTFGPKFVGAYPALLALWPGMILLGQSKLMSADLAARGLPQHPARASWISLIVTLGLDFALIPILGIMGAAIASSAAYTVSAVIIYLAYRRETGTTLRDLYLVRWTEITDAVARIAAFTGSISKRQPHVEEKP